MSLPSDGCIVRIPRSDSEEGFVLLNTIPNGPATLDLRLLATEGDSPYAGEIKQSRYFKLKDRKSLQDDETWESVLVSTLLQRNIIDDSIDCVASIATSCLSIVFRKNISGITQRLGEIRLNQDESLELDTIRWTNIAIQRGVALEQEVKSLRATNSIQKTTIDKLSRQLEDLVVAKTEHEDALLVKFQLLLNSKKLKIRNQQRILAGASVDPRQVKKSPVATRAKRKAQSPIPDVEDTFEERHTPETSDQDTMEDEDPKEDLVEDDAPIKDEYEDLERTERTNTAPSKLQLDEPPPARELPFARSQATQQSSTIRQHQENGENDHDDETTDDDEL